MSKHYQNALELYSKNVLATIDKNAFILEVAKQYPSIFCQLVKKQETNSNYCFETYVHSVLIKHFPGAYTRLQFENLISEFRQSKVHGIKETRRLTGCSLKEARDFSDEVFS